LPAPARPIELVLFTPGVMLVQGLNVQWEKRDDAGSEHLLKSDEVFVRDLGVATLHVGEQPINDIDHGAVARLDATNAVNNWQFNSDFIGDYEKMIAAFRKANPAAKIFVCYPTPDFPGRWGINEKTIRGETIPMIRAVADETGARVIDLHSALAGKADLFPDTVHPNDEGAKLMAAEIFRALTGKSPPEDKSEPAASAAAQKNDGAKTYNLFPPYFAWNNNFHGSAIGWQPGMADAPQWTASFNFSTNGLYGYPASIRGWHYGWNPAGDDLFPKRLSDITSIPCSFSYNCGGNDLHGDFAYDMFLRQDDRKAKPHNSKSWCGRGIIPRRLARSFRPMSSLPTESPSTFGLAQTLRLVTTSIRLRRTKKMPGCRTKAA
jgi:hypothetical protein